MFGIDKPYQLLATEAVPCLGWPRVCQTTNWRTGQRGLVRWSTPPLSSPYRSPSCPVLALASDGRSGGKPPAVPPALPTTAAELDEGARRPMPGVLRHPLPVAAVGTSLDPFYFVMKHFSRLKKIMMMIR